MRQQNPIVINFEDIFREDTSKTQLSLFSTSLQHSIEKPLTSTYTNEFMTTHQQSIDFIRPKKSLNRNSIHSASASQQLYNLNRLIQQQQEKRSRSKTHNVDICKLTDKLNNSSLCNKQQCVQHRSNKIIKDIEQTIPSQHNHSKSNKSHSHNKSNPFQRLHNLSRIHQLQKKYQVTQDTHKRDKSSKKNSSVNTTHLKNYVPFYSRLQEEVNRSQQRIRVMQNNPQFVTGGVEKFFKPRLIPNKYSQVSARYNQHTKSKQLLSLMNSPLSSSFSSLDRSLEINNRVQEHFYTKMRCIFANPTEQWVSINQNNVKLLTEIEFRVMEKFMLDVLDNPIKCSEFDQLLRDHLKGQSINRKLTLKNHEIRETNKYWEIRRQLSKNKREPKPQPTHLFSKKAKKAEGNYHLKIKSYV